MTYEEIFEQSKAYILGNDIEGIDGNLAIEIDIVGEGGGAFYIELKDGRLSVEPYEYYDNDCKFLVSGEDFLAMCAGRLDPVLAFTRGKLKIEGSIEKALEFSKIVDKVKKKAAKAEKAAKRAK